jgi:hypothetical protein
MRALLVASFVVAAPFTAHAQTRSRLRIASDAEPLSIVVVASDNAVARCTTPCELALPLGTVRYHVGTTFEPSRAREAQLTARGLRLRIAGGAHATAGATALISSGIAIALVGAVLSVIGIESLQRGYGEWSANAARDVLAAGFTASSVGGTFFGLGLRVHHGGERPPVEELAMPTASAFVVTFTARF